MANSFSCHSSSRSLPCSHQFVHMPRGRSGWNTIASPSHPSPSLLCALVGLLCQCRAPGIAQRLVLSVSAAQWGRRAADRQNSATTRLFEPSPVSGLLCRVKPCIREASGCSFSISACFRQYVGLRWPDVAYFCPYVVSLQCLLDQALHQVWSLLCVHSLACSVSAKHQASRKGLCYQCSAVASSCSRSTKFCNNTAFRTFSCQLPS
jgi:hypothetical protein